MTRRSIVFGSASVAAATATKGFLGGNDPTASSTSFSLNEAMEWIDEFCDKNFLHSVVASDYRFLYRGETTSAFGPMRERSDLLDLVTYGSPSALEHFRQLEILMKEQPVRPSNGHLATTSVSDASQWGTACSVWPKHVGHFAWFEHGGLFYPRDLRLNTVLINGKDCGQENLEDILVSDDSEVMFSAQEYLVVPARLDNDLRSKLRGSFLI